MVNVYFEHQGSIVTLPVNPEELTMSIPGNNENATVVGLGEVNILRAPRLSPISISSFFPEEEDPQTFIDFFVGIQKKAEPLRVVCKDFNLNMLTGIDGFEYSMRAGEEGDRYYTLELQEWRDYSPQKAVQQVEVKLDTMQTPPPKVDTPVIVEFNVGDTVTFSGGNHYVASTATTPTGGNRTAGKAKVTGKATGARHPIHLIGLPGGSNVYGWVDRGQVSK